MWTNVIRITCKLTAHVREELEKKKNTQVLNSCALIVQRRLYMATKIQSLNLTLQANAIKHTGHYVCRFSVPGYELPIYCKI